MENVIVDDRKNRHGFLRGYHFALHDHELMRLLDQKLGRRRLPHPLPDILLDNVKVRGSHPADLYEEHKEHEEAGCIYFFAGREYRTRGRRPTRTTKDGGTWKATGGSKAVRERRGGAVLGYKLTMVFYQKEEPRKTDWALHEYTRIDGHGPDKKPKVKSLALYRLYKKKAGQGAAPAPAEVEANQATVAASSTSPQTNAGQPHHHDVVNGVTPAAVNPHASSCMGQTGPPTSPRQETVSHVGYAAGLAGWDNMPLLSLPPPIAAVAQDLPLLGRSSYPETTPPPLPLSAPAAEGYLADELKVCCETTKQKLDEPQGAASPVAYNDDLPIFMDRSELDWFTLEELLAAIMQDDLLLDLPMPDANKDDTTAPGRSAPDERQPSGSMQEQSKSGS